MQSIVNEHSSNLTHDQISEWFDKTICSLEGDKFMMQNKIANPETEKMYNSLITGNIQTVLMEFRKMSGGFIAKNIVVDFVDSLINTQHLPSTLAFSVSDSKVFLWAEIKENDETAEDAIIESEAKINAKYYEVGYNVSTTIIEDCDKLKTPRHYINIPIIELSKTWQTLQNT